ncbi:hypothetical protein DPMN_177944 [Dreissena polymorpha]|uniref:Uncharacterized protein n=1 Tax=Dreissena polymorpha TaxID=45954 RepID=A0A9D4ED57_DREPO|nr:hypothetical protein DPMN_177944 [Dreissena polymorpha]
MLPREDHSRAGNATWEAQVKVGKVRLAGTFPHTTSTTWHQEMPCIGPCPVMTPVWGLHQSPVNIDQSGQENRSCYDRCRHRSLISLVTSHAMTCPVTGQPVIDQSGLCHRPFRSP